MGIRRKNVTAKQKCKVLQFLKAGLSDKKVADTVKLSLSTVYKIRREEQRTREMKAEAQADAEDMRRHRGALLAVLEDLQEIDVFPPRGYEIQTWLAWPEEPSWPITKGRVYRDDKGKLSVRLFAEEKLEWQYLKQHLAGDPVWDAIESWKLAMAEDMAARRNLFGALLRQVESGTKLKVLPEIKNDSAEGPCVHLYYGYTIYDQVISQVLGIRLGQKRRDEFIHEAEGKVRLGSYPAVIRGDATQVDRAIDFLLEAQTKLVELPEAKAAAQAYHQAEKRTGEVKQALRRILLTPGLPPASMCESCRPWLEALRAR